MSDLAQSLVNEILSHTGANRDDAADATIAVLWTLAEELSVLDVKRSALTDLVDEIREM